ncbi:Uncharacterized protein RNJ44_01537 [Nakaseomyces bracarensis]|uniref:TATA-binding protein interacting (TIP20) domain-containing protein n=1 Tax=Nakaseomyces bracarensis TaxID=273131 RepID=A0ABR4NQ45_9SACH
MNVLEVIKQYKGTSDNDIKYMALKQPVQIKNIQLDFNRLMLEIYLPELVTGDDPELKQLICFEILPKLTLSLFSEQIEESVTPDLMWAYIERFVFNRIIDKMTECDEEALETLLQALRNIVFLLHEKDITVFTVTKNKLVFDDHYKTEYQADEIYKLANCMKIEYMKMNSVAGLQGYQEILQKLIEISFDGRVRPLDIRILRVCAEVTKDFETFNKSTGNLFYCLIERARLFEVGDNFDLFNLNNLAVMSKIWYKFQTKAEQILSTKATELKSETEPKKVDKIIRIINNMKAYMFQTTIINNNSPLIDTKFSLELSMTLIQALSNTLSDMEKKNKITKPSNVNNFIIPQEKQIDINIEDVDQQAYLEELDADLSSNYDEDLSFTVDFEDDENSSSVLMIDEMHLSEINEYKTVCYSIVSNSLDFFYSLFEAGGKAVYHAGEELDSLRSSLVYLKGVADRLNSDLRIDSLFMEFFEKVDNNGNLKHQDYDLLQMIDIQKFILGDNHEKKDQILYTIRELLKKDDNSLKDLQSIIEIIDILVGLRSQHVDAYLYLDKDDQNQIARALLPHLKTNKTFVYTIKVGNISKKVDEGATFRTMVYTTISRLEITDHLVVCALIEFLLRYGIKDKQDIIKQIAQSTLKRLLNENYEQIQALELQWYSQIVLPLMTDSSLPVNDFFVSFPPIIQVNTI